MMEPMLRKPSIRRILSTTWRMLTMLTVAGVGWVVLDLYLRLDLPVAATLAHLAFRSVVAPLEWLTEGDGLRLQLLIGVWGVGAIITLLSLLCSWNFARITGRWFWSVTGILASCFILLTVSLGLLMERALSVGMMVAVGIAWLSGGLESHQAATAKVTGVTFVLALMATAGLGVGATYYIYALFMTYGEGYPILDFLGDLVRNQAVDFLAVYMIGAALLTFLAALLVFWRRGDRVRRPGRLAVAAVAGVSLSVVLDQVLDLDGPVSSPLLVVPFGLLLASLLWSPLRSAGQQPLSGTVLARVGLFPLRLVVPFLLSAICISHAYAARIFRCSDVEPLPYITRIANLPEVFRVTLFARHHKLALSIRAQRRLGWIRLLPNLGTVQITRPGPANLDLYHGEKLRQLAGVPEDFVHAPSLDRFFVSLTAHDPHSMRAKTNIKYHGNLARGRDVNNMIATVSGDAGRVLDVVGVPGLCWLNCMRWNDAERLLYLGCEDRPGLFRYDPVRRVFRDGTIDTSIGDVQDIAFDYQSRRLFTVSLWKTAILSELGWKTLDIKRQLSIGGSHYDVVYDPKTHRIFASAWYGSRVRVVDARKFVLLDSIPTGLGTRALAVANRQELLLASSIYDGRLRICDPGSGKILASLPVGGHVKDIAVDEKRGVAYFWSQCGLFKLDLGQWSKSKK